MEFKKEEIEERINQKIEIGIKQYGKEFKFLVLEIIGLEKMISPSPEAEKRSRLIPLSEWNKYYPYPTKGTLYQYNFNRKQNGFSECVEKGGSNCGRILINEDKFWKWHNRRNQNNDDN